MVSASTCQAGGLWFKSSILPLLKHVCGESDWLLSWPYTLAEGGVAPEVNLRERISRMPLQSSNKAAHSKSETQRRCHQKSETGVQVAPKMDMCPTNFFFKKKRVKVILVLFYLQTLVTVFVLQMQAFLNQSRTKRFQITASILWVFKFT